MFKNLQGRVTVTVKTDANDGRTTSTKTFLVGSETVSETMSLGEVQVGSNQYGDSFGFTTVFSPFQKKKVSFLEKGQAITIGLSNAEVDETFTIAQMTISGHRKPQKMFKPENIVSV